MWRILISSLVLAGTVAGGKTTFGQAPREPYGPFDAIAEGARNSELQRLSAIDAQLDTVDALRSLRVAQRGVFLGPDVAVYPYGRRGILGLRPRGYVVMRRTPVVINGDRSQLTPPPPPTEYAGRNYGGYSTDSEVRQPIGHESLQTGPNRWEYRPLYADDDHTLDAVHGEIERNLGPLGNADRVPRESPPPAERPDAAGDLEELPVPSDDGQPRQAQPARGQARDIARSAAFAGEKKDAPRKSSAGDNLVNRRAPPPPPTPDPPSQQRSAPTKPAQTPIDAELRGPLLQNPSTGTREF